MGEELPFLLLSDDLLLKQGGSDILIENFQVFSVVFFGIHKLLDSLPSGSAIFSQSFEQLSRPPSFDEFECNELLRLRERLIYRVLILCHLHDGVELALRFRLLWLQLRVCSGIALGAHLLDNDVGN